MNPVEFAIRVRLDELEPLTDGMAETAFDALRAVLDLCDVVERNRANFDALGTGHLMVSMSHDILRVIAEKLGVVL